MECAYSPILPYSPWDGSCNPCIEDCCQYSSRKANSTSDSIFPTDQLCRDYHSQYPCRSETNRSCNNYGKDEEFPDQTASVFLLELIKTLRHYQFSFCVSDIYFMFSRTCQIGGISYGRSRLFSALPQLTDCYSG